MSRPIAPAGILADPKYSRALDTATGVLLRYGLVLMILWIGVFKFTPTEAKAIEPLVANSPLLAWLLAVAGVDGASRIIGISEIVIAALLAVRPWWPRLSLAGSIGAIGMFLTTLSFLVTTPGSWRVVDGLLVPAGGGFFILKDVVLLGAACWTASDALNAVRRPASVEPMA
jgi:reactive chlorine resistance protein C